MRLSFSKGPLIVLALFKYELSVFQHLICKINVRKIKVSKNLVPLIAVFNNHRALMLLNVAVHSLTLTNYF